MKATITRDGFLKAAVAAVVGWFSFKRARAATQVSLFQIATSPSASPGSIVLVTTTGQILQVQLGAGFALTVNAAGVPTLINAIGSSGGFTHAETPAGAINGANALFTLSGTPILATSLLLTRNGLAQASGVDYSLAANTVTFLPGSIPQSGDAITARY